MRKDTKKALLVIDVQRNYFMEGSEYEITDAYDVLRRINHIVDKFREEEEKIIFIRHAHKSDGSDIDIFSDTVEETGFVEGTKGVEFMDGLNINENDIVLTKTRYDAFINTGLEDELKKEGINHLVVVGFMSGFCISSTVRSAHSKDYHITVIADCISNPTLPDVGFGKQEGKKVTNVELSIIASGLGEIVYSREFLHSSI